MKALDNLARFLGRWRPYSTIPRDGSVVEIRNGFAIPVWIHRFAWNGTDFQRVDTPYLMLLVDVKTESFDPEVWFSWRTANAEPIAQERTPEATQKQTEKTGTANEQPTAEPGTPEAK